ncbi:MAG: MarR family transcriptional regulator [Flavobacterium sp.]|nr:MAG: MarR family transcriptional regulator [Flavobacterium sp.]
MEKTIIGDVRAFNRYYTNLIGLLDQGYLDTQYTLTEARILFEISTGAIIETSWIIDALLIDKSYLSRVLKKFEEHNLITRSRSEKDSRASQISLTKDGLDELNALNDLADRRIKELLKGLSTKDKKQLVLHMNSITDILDSNIGDRKE